MHLDYRHAIRNDIRALSPRAWSRKDIETFLKERRSAWNAPAHLNTSGLIDFLLENRLVKNGEIISEYGSKSRYIVGKLSLLQFACAFYKGSFLSHSTALHLHGIGPLQEILVNHEQSPKKTTSRLSQGRINLAFENSPRSSSYVFRTRSGKSIRFLNGKHTGNAGVIEIKGSDGKSLRTTSLERTLIDIVVRPQYAGGIQSVLGAFRTTRDRIRIEHFPELLKLTQYAYPYHQALGFLLQRAGVPATGLATLAEIPKQFRFYVDYAMTDPAYDPEWKVYYPANFD